jgi:hypothetical protein
MVPLPTPLGPHTTSGSRTTLCASDLSEEEDAVEKRSENEGLAEMSMLAAERKVRDNEMGRDEVTSAITQRMSIVKKTIVRIGDAGITLSKWNSNLAV